MAAITYSANNGSGNATIINGIQLVDKTTYIITDPFAGVRFSTDATIVDVTYYNDYFDSFPELTKIGVYINGKYYKSLAPFEEGTTTDTVILPAGTKTVSFYNGPQSGVGVSNSTGTFLTDIDFTNGDATEVSVTSGTRVMVYGDSITVGDGSNVPQESSWAMQLRENNNNKYTAFDARGSRSLWDDAQSAPLLSTFVSNASTRNPDIIWICVGTNDYALERWSAADFGTAYASMLDDLNTALPSATIYCQSPTVRTSEAANSFGDTLGDYRSAISTAVSTRTSFATFVDGTTIITTADLADNVHPDQGGHNKIYSAVLSETGITDNSSGQQSMLYYNIAGTQSLSPTSGIGPTINCTRGTVGTYRDSSGVMQTAAIDTARINYDENGNCLGVLVEDAATNECFPSEDLADGVQWTIVSSTLASVSSNAIAAPDGTTTADKLIENTNTGGHALQNTVTTGAGQHCFSIFLKAGERDWAALYCNSLSVGKYFDLTNGLVGGNLTGAPDDAGIEPWSNGWYRCYITFTDANATEACQIYLATGDGGFSYAGDGTSGLYAWGSQVEDGAKPSSYISASIQTSRFADDVGTSDLSWFNESAGSLYVSYRRDLSNGQAVILQIDDGTSAERHLFVSDNNNDGTGDASYGVVDGAGVQASITINNSENDGSINRIVAAYSVNDFQSYINGTAGSADSSGTLPTSLTEMALGRRGYDDSLYLNGHIAEIRYYDSRLTNAQLEAMSNGVFPEGGIKLIYDITRDVTRNITRDISG